MISNSTAVKIIDRRSKYGLVNQNKTNDSTIRQNINDIKDIERPTSNYYNISNNKPNKLNINLNQYKKDLM